MGDIQGVDGNVVSNNGAAGVAIAGGSDNQVMGNTIGTDPTGTQARGNTQSGVLISDGSDNTIGGTTASPGTGPGNLISGNSADGIQIVGSSGSGNLLEGNLIGTDLNGEARLGNALSGVVIDGSPSNTIGGRTSPTGSGLGNVISGNGLTGITILGAGAERNSLLGNAIGTGLDGSTPIGNAQDGVLLNGVSKNIVGGTTPNSANLISANSGNGVEILGAGASSNVVAGNAIGTTAGGESALGNAQNGISMSGGATDNLIGGADPGAGNLISGNVANGISLYQGATANQVLGNKIGTDATGTSSLGNVFSGVVVSATSGNVIGAPGAGNLISGNSSSGVVITGAAATGNTVQANLIGTDASGTKPLGNSATGVTIDSAPGNLIGGADTSSGVNPGNVIAANRTFGVVLINVGATGNQVVGNLIGTNADGSRVLGNALDGVLVNDAPGDLIGGPSPLSRNVISGNGGNGIDITGVPSPGGTTVRFNLIGTNPTGRAALSNAFDGVLIADSTATAVLSNLISGNGRDGVELSGGSEQSTLLGNAIGTDYSGTVAVSNQGDGVALVNSSYNVIGGSASGHGNLISGNLGAGITLSGSAGAGGAAATAGNHIQGNLIGTSAGGGSALGNSGNGITLTGAGANLIGGSGAGQGNVVSANGSIGIQIVGPDANANDLIGNTVGTNAAGTVALGNGNFGVSIEGAVATLVVTDLISGNTVGGLQIAGFGASQNLVYGNLIGTDRSGAKSLSNNIGVFINGAGSNVIGQGVPGRINVISGNATAGVYIFGRFAVGNLIQGNLIGTDATGRNAVKIPVSGTQAAGVQEAGVLINQSPGLSLSETAGAGNVIGGASATDRNTISGNVVGVTISGTESSGNVVLGNDIGTTSSGGGGVGNQTGVFLDGAPGNVIGGSVGNVISGNSVVGVYLLGTATTGNAIVGNIIGLAPGGTKALANSIGVYIENAPSNTIGGAATATHNVISDNQIVGVYILGEASTDNVVEGNTIGGSGEYGVLLYNAPTNTVPQSGTVGNKITGSGIANYREFTGATVSANPTTTAAAATTTTTTAQAIKSTGKPIPAGPRSLARRFSQRA